MTVDRNIHDAFDQIKADEKLKKNTLDYVMNHRSVQNKRFFIPRYAVLLACLLLLFAGGGYSRKLFLTPVSYVDIDINPSVELQLNRFGRVIQSNSYNEDGAVLLASLNLKYKSYDDALLLLVDALNDAGYMRKDGLLSVTVQSQTKETELLDSVQSCIGNILTSHHISMEQDIFLVDSDTKQHSHEWNVSPARYLAISELQEIDPSVTVDECRGHTIRQLRGYTNEGQGSHHRQGRNGNRH